MDNKKRCKEFVFIDTSQDMGDLQEFMVKNFSSVNTVFRNGTLYYPASRVAKILGFNESSAKREINKNFSENDMLRIKESVCDGTPPTRYIPEEGVYKLISLSKLPEAMAIAKKYKMRTCEQRLEIEFGAMIDSIFKGLLKFERQFFCCGKYKIDFYEPNFKLAIEYDEMAHKYNKERDLIREKEIKKKLGCTFIRVNEGKETDGINEILKFVYMNSLCKAQHAV